MYQLQTNASFLTAGVLIPTQDVERLRAGNQDGQSRHLIKNHHVDLGTWMIKVGILTY